MITREHNAFYKRTFDAYMSLTGSPEYAAYKATETLDEFIEAEKMAKNGSGMALAKMAKLLKGNNNG